MKHIILLLILLMLIPTATADETIIIGQNGLDFYDNVTMDNTVDFEECQNITLLPTIYDDFRGVTLDLSKWKNSTAAATFSQSGGELTVTGGIPSPAESYNFSGAVYIGENYTNGSYIYAKQKAAANKMHGVHILDESDLLIASASEFPQGSGGRQYIRYRTGATSAASSVFYNPSYADTYSIAKTSFQNDSHVDAYYYYSNYTEIMNTSANPWDLSNPTYAGLGSVYASIISVYDWVHNDIYSTSGNITYNASNIVNATNEIKTMSWNGSIETGETVDLYASVDNITFTLVNASHPIDIKIDVSGNLYRYTRWNLNTTQSTNTPDIYNIIITHGTIATGATFDYKIIQEDKNNESYNFIIEFSNYSASLAWINASWSGTESGHAYHWNYWNGTEISSQTATSNNQTLWFNHTVAEISEGKYYISETSITIETFVVPIAAFTAVVVAGVAVVSRRVRRGISGFWNRRIRRR